MEKDLGKTVLEQMPYELPKEKRSISPWTISLSILVIIALGIFYYFEKEKIKNVIPIPSQLLGNADNSLGDINSIEKDLEIPEASENF